MHFIDLRIQCNRIEDRVLARFKQIMHHGAFIMGPEINELEQKLAEFIGVKHALTVASGTDALLISLMALDIQAGDEIITTPFSFFATAEVIALLGAKPVFVDIERDTYNIDPCLIEKAITPRTKAIMPVSMYGHCANIEAINNIAMLHNLPVIEDAAQSFGASCNIGMSCGLTTIGCTSFFPSKPLGCYGDGGACFTNSDELALRIQEIRNHGQSKRYCHTRLGINGRFDTLQAAVLLEKLPFFNEEIELRQEVANKYALLLPKFIKKPLIAQGNRSVYAQYTIEVNNREKVQEKLHNLDIPTAIHYPLGLHEQPIFKKLYPSKERFIHTESAASMVMSLPMHPYLTNEQQITISDALHSALTD